jgi:hypothetical protein
LWPRRDLSFFSNCIDKKACHMCIKENDDDHRDWLGSKYTKFTKLQLIIKAMAYSKDANSHPSTFQPYFSPGLPRKGLGESYMFVTQPLWRHFCIVITPLNGLLREHFPGLYWRAWRCRTLSWARGSNSCVSFPWAPTLVPIMGISLVSQPSDSIPCSYYMPKAYHVVVSLEVCIISFEASSL